MTITEIKKRILSILKKYRVKKASLFGSIVRNKQTESSDIDILVEMPENASLLKLANLKLDLEEILKKKVDVLAFNSLHPSLRDKILLEQEALL